MKWKPYYFFSFVLLSMQVLIVLLLGTACMNKKPVKSVQYKYIYITSGDDLQQLEQQLDQQVPRSLPMRFANVSLSFSRHAAPQNRSLLSPALATGADTAARMAQPSMTPEEAHPAMNKQAEKKVEEHPREEKKEEHGGEKEEHAEKKEQHVGMEEHSGKPAEEHRSNRQRADKKEEQRADKKEHGGRKEENAERKEEHPKEEQHMRMDEHAERKEQHVERKEQHVERKEQHEERKEQHVERKEQHEERKEQHAERKEQHVERKEQHAERKEQHVGQHANISAAVNSSSLHAVEAHHHVEPELPPLEPDVPVVVTDAPRAHGENSILRPETVSLEFKFAQEVFDYPAHHLLYHLQKPVATYVRELLPDSVEGTGREYVLWDRERFKRRGGQYWRGKRKKKGSDPSKIHKIWVWGERNSCTTLITSLLRENFNMNCSSSAPSTCVIGGLPWKHGFMRNADLRDQSRTLNLLVTRSPYEWIDSMHRHPFYAEIHKGLNMSTFLSREWITFDDAFDRVFAGYELNELRAARRGLNCHDDIRLHNNETCLSGGKSFRCVELPGLKADVPWIVNSTHSPHPSCFPGPKSHAACGDSFLCRDLDPRWLQHKDLGSWRRNVSDYILNSALRPRGIFVPDHPKLSSDLSQLTCISFRWYIVSSGDELPPAKSCHDGDSSWGKCSGGRFMCHVNTTRWWVAAPHLWTEVMNRLLSASRQIREYLFAHLFKPPLASSEKLEDRDADTGGRFPNILAMRAAKLRDWFQVADQHIDFSSHVACRDFFIDPHAVLNELRDEFDLKPSHPEWQLSQCMMMFGKFSCPQQHRGYEWTSNLTSAKRNYYTQGHFARAFNRNILKLMSAWLDPELESSLGYRVHEDLRSLSVPYTPLTRCRDHRPAVSLTSMPCYGNCSNLCHSR
ncbi:hypothetical protein GUITHDRAFT_114055 [Guillardia theta CCMP2712]|uniref:Sulfotransferase domain-containing protein n=1 Tax=Guillardia theta (strain CCMP2712) TaxID=905079 RepID=L1IVB3_GUITC|nr:hypothetical protein GUITHDRAFT_114055 [Guillardia theta CCMP2712]EKX39804.1 hypothetical protein GUITHDRAFT_114055 [Guillardia theta CCMP2712]|eukprot:XP_005826784.1 hypothetical protein GUITHDRAFT_114055 [Guillardia theta CCMP2712]